MVKAYARPEKEGYVLVTFFHGTDLATQEKYTDWDQSVAGATPEPRMSIRIPENSGTFDTRELRIVLPQDFFTNRASGGVLHSPMFVLLEEFTAGLFPGDQSSQKILFAGRVTRTVANFQGKAGLVAFFSLLQKSRLDVPMSIACNHHCGNTMFKGGCGVVQSGFQVSVDIDSVDGTEVTITTAGFTTPGSTDDRYWKRGYLLKDGLRISIRDYDGSVDTSKAIMARPVPTDWIGGSSDILAVPGCDKTVEVCRSRYNAEEFFLGLGFAIPAYQPNFEVNG